MKKVLKKRKHDRFSRWAAICAASIMLIMCGITGRAAQTGTVNIDNVNVRTQASAESDRVCKLAKDTELSIIDQTTGNDGNVWYSVTFALEGEEKSGWIRSDMVTVSETEEPEGEGQEGGSPVPTGSYSIQEPVEAYPDSSVLSKTGIQVGENNFTAWVVDAGVTGGRELYLVWASDQGGNQGWFYYDPQDGTFQREMGQFAGGGSGEPEGMIESLQEEMAGLKEESAKSLSQRLYVIIGLSVLSVILLIIVIVLAIKLRGTEYEYYDDEDEDEDDEEDDDDYYEDEPKRKRGGLFRRRAREEEEEELDDEKSDFDDLLIAVKKKWAEEDEREAHGGDYEEEEDEEDYEEDTYEEEEEIGEEDDILSEEELPEIDMSAILEIEKEKQKEKPASLEEEEEDDFDIEILDLDDLDL